MNARDVLAQAWPSGTFPLGTAVLLDGDVPCEISGIRGHVDTSTPLVVDAYDVSRRGIVIARDVSPARVILDDGRGFGERGL